MTDNILEQFGDVFWYGDAHIKERCFGSKQKKCYFANTRKKQGESDASIIIIEAIE